MYPFIVHVERVDLQPWDVLVNQPGQRNSLVRVANSYNVNVKANMDNYEHSNCAKFETWYCDTRQKADALANKLARELPGRNILVLELKTVTQTMATEPVVSNYSERGLVPA